jgi:hypothetical protein
MAEVISVYRNDKLPDLDIDITDYDPVASTETPKDLNADGTIVYFKTRLKEGGTVLKVDSVFKAIDATQGQFSYEWQSQDNDTAGVYLAEISLELSPVVTSHRGVWSNATAYAVGDVVFFNSAIPLAYAGSWSYSVGYILNNVVLHNGLYWQCLLASTNVEPGTATANWQLLTNNRWRCTTAHTASQPGVSPINWVQHKPKHRTILQFELNVWEDL